MRGVLHPHQQIVAGNLDDHVRRADAQPEHQRIHAAVIMLVVSLRPSGRPAGGVGHLVMIAVDQDVLAVAAGEGIDVVALPAVQRVVALAAVQDVVAILAVKRVVAGAAVDEIEAAAGVDGVVAAAADQVSGRQCSDVVPPAGGRPPRRAARLAASTSCTVVPLASLLSLTWSANTESAPGTSEPLAILIATVTLELLCVHRDIGGIEVEPGLLHRVEIADQPAEEIARTGLVELEIAHSSKSCNPTRGKSRVGVCGDQRVDDFAVVEIGLVILRHAEVAAHGDELFGCRELRLSRQAAARGGFLRIIRRRVVVRPLQQEVAADHLGVLQHVERRGVHGVVGIGKAVVGVPRRPADKKQVRILRCSRG